MNRVNEISRCLPIVLLGTILTMNSTVSTGQETSDCNSAMEFDVDDEFLTRSEVIALMNDLFYESLAEYQECIGGSATQSQSDGGGGGGSGSGQNASFIESVAAMGLEGTETPEKQSQTDEVVVSTQSDVTPVNNGSPPADIPPADNDNIVAAQIRLAAENETDPVEQAKLWNEYRRYKRLPLKPVPESTSQ